MQLDAHLPLRRVSQFGAQALIGWGNLVVLGEDVGHERSLIARLRKAWHTSVQHAVTAFQVRGNFHLSLHCAVQEVVDRFIPAQVRREADQVHAVVEHAHLPHGQPLAIFQRALDQAHLLQEGRLPCVHRAGDHTFMHRLHMRQRHQFITPGTGQGVTLESLDALGEESKHEIPAAQVFFPLRIEHGHKQRELFIGEVSTTELEPLMLAAGLSVFGRAFAILRRHFIRQEKLDHLLLNAAAGLHRLAQRKHGSILRVKPMRDHAPGTGEGLAGAHAAGHKEFQHLAGKLQPLAHHAQVNLSPDGRLPGMRQGFLA